MRATFNTLAIGLLLPFLFACSSLALPARHDPVRMDAARIDAQFPPASVETTIRSAGARLPGLLYLANGPGPHPTIILAHGYPGNEKNLDLAQAIRRDGFNVLFFHYRGAWGADGNYSLTQLHEDVLAALAHLRAADFAAANRIDPARLSAIGHSMGGYAVLRAASMDADLKCVAGLSAVNLAARMTGFDDNPELALQGFRDYTDGLFMLKGFSGAEVLQELQDNRTAFDPAGFTEGLRGKSVLLLTGDVDPVTPADTMQAPMAALFGAEPDIRLTHEVIPGDHSFSWTRQLLADRVTGWLDGNCR